MGVYLFPKNQYMVCGLKSSIFSSKLCNMFFLWSLYSWLLKIRPDDKYEIFSHWDEGWEFQHLVNIILLTNLPYYSWHELYGYLKLSIEICKLQLMKQCTSAPPGEPWYSKSKQPKRYECNNSFTLWLFKHICT